MKFVRSGDYLADVRKESELTQSEIAKKLKWSTPQMWSNAERGLCSIPAKYFKKINKAMPRFDVNHYIECICMDVYDSTKAKLKGKA